MTKKDATPKQGRVRKAKSPVDSAPPENVSEAHQGEGENALPRSVGRPTKYQPEKHVREVRELCLLGLTDEEIARVFDVSVQTLNTWKHQHPDFLESMRDGKEKADARVAARLYERAMGYEHPDVHITAFRGEITETPVIRIYPPDTQAARFWLMNRQPSRFRERTVTEISGIDGAPIETVTGTVTDFAALREKIKAKAGA